MRVCPICEATTFTDRRLAPGLEVHRCVGCGLLLSTIRRAEPAPSEFDLVDERAYHGSVGALRRDQAAMILDALSPHLSGERILDVGCSFGYFLAEAQARGLTVRGIEPDARAWRQATDLLGEGVVHHGSLDRSTAADLSGDAVTLLDVLEHIPPEDHDGFGELLRAVLAPEGVLVIKVPTTEGLYYKLSHGLARVAPRLGSVFVRRLWQTEYEYPHTVYFDRSTLERWLVRHGFVPLAHHYLPEVPARTVIDRLTTDGDIPRWQAYLLAPAVLAINAVEWLRGRSDALLVVATRDGRG